jgi:heparan-alpha-glucosaminide N-acetyltransferase
MLDTADKISLPRSGVNEQRSPGRINSIDVFRGLTIFAMIFVNDVAGVSNIPGWLKHMPADADGMTFVDLVFPAFLFIVGMAIPFAINKRIKQGTSRIEILKHIIIRTAGLLILGVLMVNMGSLNSEATGINKQLWILFVFIAVIIVWNSYPKKSGNEKYFFYVFRLLGVVALVVLAAVYRGGNDNNIHWLRTSWWGILGLIGWAYLASSVIYLLFRNYPAALVSSMFIFMLTYPAEKAGLFDSIYSVNNSLLIGMQVGSHTSVVIAGIILSVILIRTATESLKKKISIIVVYSVMLLIVGYLTEPLFGINKNLATPAWCFYSSFYCVIIFIFLYLIIDHKGYDRWSNFLKPAGINPLLAYILPSIFYALISLTGFSFYSALGSGFTGVIRSLVFSLFILGVTWMLTRVNVKLHL